MLKNLALALTLLIAAPAVANAQAIDCSGGCTVTKYGTAHPDDFDFRRPTDRFANTHEDFQGSYLFIRSNPADPGGTGCGIEREFVPVVGQLLLREQDGCVPTEVVGCPVEVPQDLPGLGGQSAWSSGVFTEAPGLFDLLSSGDTALGRTSDPDDPTCLAENIRTLPPQGTRFVLPASRGGDGVKTYIRWSDADESYLWRHSPTKLCCNSTSETFCDLIGPFSEYPVLTLDTCADEDLIYELKNTNDWIFEGGAGTDFITDRDHIVPGQQIGLCRVNRFQGCDLGGVDPCPTLDADPDTDGLQPDDCDVRERGFRSTRPANLSNGFPNTLACANSPTVIQATAGANCFLVDAYEQQGDPGENCDVLNFGARFRPDLDCDGEPDAEDLCPLLNEYDPFVNSDAALGGDPVRTYGDECECGDQTRDGIIDVNDILAVNAAIFDPSQAVTTCDTNNDLTCNVDDILGVNREIFDRETATCREITALNCGDGNPEPPAEECDDGNRISGDGCDAACRLE
jgi:cysteine-rich repeat protein